MIFPSRHIGLDRRLAFGRTGLFALPACATLCAYTRKGFAVILAALWTL